MYKCGDCAKFHRWDDIFHGSKPCESNGYGDCEENWLAHIIAVHENDEDLCEGFVLRNTERM